MFKTVMSSGLTIPLTGMKCPSLSLLSSFSLMCFVRHSGSDACLLTCPVSLESVCPPFYSKTVPIFKIYAASILWYWQTPLIQALERQRQEDLGVPSPSWPREWVPWQPGLQRDTLWWKPTTIRLSSVGSRYMDSAPTLFTVWIWMGGLRPLPLRDTSEMSMGGSHCAVDFAIGCVPSAILWFNNDGFIFFQSLCYPHSFQIIFPVSSLSLVCWI